MKQIQRRKNIFLKQKHSVSCYVKTQRMINIIPSLITIAAICFGITAIQHALMEKWKIATLFILVSALLDMLDGRVARALNATTKFGGELDSLADILNFGVAPAIVLYIWSLHETPSIGWICVLLMIVCCAIRLAKFNCANLHNDIPKNEILYNDMITHAPQYRSYNFIGIPSTISGIIVLSPIMLSFEFPNLEYIFRHPATVISLMILLSILMISNLTTPSLKHINVSTNNIILPIFILFCVIIFITVDPWLMMPIASCVYILYILIMNYKYRKT